MLCRSGLYLDRGRPSSRGPESSRVVDLTPRYHVLCVDKHIVTPVMLYSSGFFPDGNDPTTSQFPPK